MARLSDIIADFISDMMHDDNYVELKRNELADFFDCAPSQINYVLTSRFNFDNGYIIESKRGGGGYIRVIKVKSDDNGDFIAEIVKNRLSDPISDKDAYKLIEALGKREFFTLQECEIINRIVQDETINIPSPTAKDILRSSILKAAIVAKLNSNISKE